MQIVVRGVGDVGSAVALHLFREGHAVVLHDVPMPTTTRRGMAFVDAVFDGHVLFEGVHAVRAHDLKRVQEALGAHRAIPIYVRDIAGLLTAVGPDVLVDARMRKHSEPEAQLGLAKITIGIGPNFTAASTTDFVVESAWGDALGRVLTVGASLPCEGEPRPIEGHGRDRYVYAPCDGLFRTRLKIGDVVTQGQSVAQVESTSLCAPLGGALRGLTRDGVPVTTRTKVIEVDPRGATAEVRGIGDRPRRIAEGVVEVLRRLTS